MHVEHPRNDIDYMLSESRSQLLNLSQMADLKANILLSIASVITTVAIAKYTDPTWSMPVVVLVIFLMGAIFCALMTVVPSMRLLRPRKITVNDPNFNSLFFGDFALVPYKDYIGHMEGVLNDSNRIYEAQLREIYYAGKYLHSKKFVYVKYGYILFFLGVLSSVIIFLIDNIQ